MWKHFVEQGRSQITIWRTHIACWITKTTNTHSQCVIIIVFHCKSSFKNAPQYYVDTQVACLVWVYFDADQINRNNAGCFLTIQSFIYGKGNGITITCLLYFMKCCGSYLVREYLVIFFGKSKIHDSDTPLISCWSDYFPRGWGGVGSACFRLKRSKKWALEPVSCSCICTFDLKVETRQNMLQKWAWIEITLLSNHTIKDNTGPCLGLGTSDIINMYKQSSD